MATATPLPNAEAMVQNWRDPYVRVIALTIAMAAALRLAGLIMILVTPSLPRYLILQCITGLTLGALAFDYLRRGNSDHAALLIGFEVGAIAVNEFLIGLTSNLAYLMLVHPFLTLTMVRRSVWVKVVLAATPPLLVVALRFAIGTPENTGLLPDHTLKLINATIMLVIAIITMAVTLALTQRQRAAAIEARRLAASRKRLIDDMSHEMRTPIAVQRAAAQRALGLPNASRQQLTEALRVAETQSSSLTSIVDQLLHLATLDRELMDPVFEDPLIPATRSIIAEYEPLALQHGVSIRLVCADLERQTDANLLRFVLANLVVNAIRHSPDGGVVSVDIADSSRGTTLTVADQGPGIHPDQREQVFERFWRADVARSRTEGHAGLGLAIARRCAEHLGATLSCEQAPGGGAAFVMRWRSTPFQARN